MPRARASSIDIQSAGPPRCRRSSIGCARQMAWMLQRVWPPVRQDRMRAARGGQRLPARQRLVGLEEPRVVEVELLAAGERRPRLLALHVHARRVTACRPARSRCRCRSSSPSDRRCGSGSRRARRASSQPRPPRDRRLAQDRVDHRDVVAGAEAAVVAEAVVERRRAHRRCRAPARAPGSVRASSAVISHSFFDSPSGGTAWSPITT